MGRRHCQLRVMDDGQPLERGPLYIRQRPRFTPPSARHALVERSLSMSIRFNFVTGTETDREFQYVRQRNDCIDVTATSTERSKR